MLRKPLLIAVLAATTATVAISSPASADPVLGALLGGGIGAAVGHSISGRDGAWVGGALGAVTGASIGANSGYYDRGSYNYYDRVLRSAGGRLSDTTGLCAAILSGVWSRL